RDYILKVAGFGLDLSQEPIKKFMTPKPVCIDKSESILSVLRKMRKGNFRHLIITDSAGNFEKLLSIKEVTNYLIDVLSDSFDLGLGLNSVEGPKLDQVG